MNYPTEKRIGEWVKHWANKSNLHVEYFFETTSTNKLAKEFDYSTFDPIVFVTENQTAGRGRGTHTWTNPEPGTALLSTWSFGLDSAPQPIVTPLLGLAVYRSLINALKVSDLSLKAPNDLYVGTKKVGGLLVEAISEGTNHRLLVGLGINVHAAPNLDHATALNGHTDASLNQDNFCSFLNNLFVEFTNAISDGSEPELSVAARGDLLVALNQNPILKNKIHSIEADGSLRSSSGLTRWTDL